MVYRSLKRAGNKLRSIPVLMFFISQIMLGETFYPAVVVSS